MENFQQKQLMEAFRIDCQALITRFELSYNTHFQNFCEIWRDMQFNLIFTYCSSKAALMPFYENTLCIAKQFLIHVTSLKEHIGALYLMYAIYYKIPRNEFKIRITMSDWKCLMELHNKIKEEEYLDANYILCKMIVDNAFIYCISDSEYGIEKHYQKKQEQPKLNVNLMPEIKDLAEPGKLLSTISQFSKIYETKKRVLCDEKGDSSLQLYNANIADDIINKIRAMQSDSRTFAKSNMNLGPSCSKLTVSSSNSETQQDKKRIRYRKNNILSKIGRGFEKGLESEPEEEEQDDDLDMDFLEEKLKKP